MYIVTMFFSSRGTMFKTILNSILYVSNEKDSVFLLHKYTKNILVYTQ